MGLFGIFLINTFGTIVTTNQQDYTLIKNVTEAAMMDSVDFASYRAGFYFCTNVGGSPKVFDSTSKYIIQLYTDYANANGCELVVGEYKLNKDVFTESFLRRFAENVNNNKSYEVTIEEIVEYPPKVSIRVDTYNTYNSDQSTTLEFDFGDYNIRNQVDAVLEERK